MPERTCTIEGCVNRHVARGLCGKHYQRWRKDNEPIGPTVEDRFWAKITLSGDCWLVMRTTKNGYGQINVGGRSGSNLYAHRWAYEHFVGPIPEGMDLDHLCRNRACANPAHLEPVTRSENLWRGLQGILRTHCANGHPINPENTWVNKKGHRRCRACARERAGVKRPYGARKSNATLLNILSGTGR